MSYEQSRYNPQYRSQDRVNTIGKIAFGTKVPPRRVVNENSSPRSDANPPAQNRNGNNQRPTRAAQPVQNGTRRMRSNEPQNQYNPPPPPPPPPPRDEYRVEPRRTSNDSRVTQKNENGASEYQDYERQPRRQVVEKKRVPYRPPPPPLVRDVTNKPNRLRVDDVQYVIERRKKPVISSNDDQIVEISSEERNSSKPIIRVVRDRPPATERSDVYYVESDAPRVVYEPSPRRKMIVRRPSAAEYVYVDDPVIRRRERPTRSDVVYVDDDRHVEYIDEYVYLDENGNEVEVIKEPRRQSGRYVEYVYEDDEERRRPRPAKVVYVDSTGQNPPRSIKPSPTRIVYE